MQDLQNVTITNLRPSSKALLFRDCPKFSGFFIFKGTKSLLLVHQNLEMAVLQSSSYYCSRIWKSRDDPTRQSLFFSIIKQHISTSICIYILLYFTTFYCTHYPRATSVISFHTTHITSPNISLHNIISSHSLA
jgi:hypothetical protein